MQPHSSPIAHAMVSVIVWPVVWTVVWTGLILLSCGCGTGRVEQGSMQAEDSQTGDVPAGDVPAGDGDDATGPDSDVAVPVAAVSAATVSCATVLFTAERTFPNRPVLALNTSTGGCGNAVVAFADGFIELNSSGGTCASHPWKTGFIPGKFRRLAHGGLLVTDKSRRSVVQASAGGVTPWLALPPADKIKFISAVETPCGGRFALTVNSSETIRLRRIGPNGSVIWQRTDRYHSLAASCDALLVSGRSPMTEMDMKREDNGEWAADGQAWLARLSLHGDVLWRRKPSAGLVTATVDLQMFRGGFSARSYGQNKVDNYDYFNRVTWRTLGGATRVTHPLGGWVSGSNLNSWDTVLPAVQWPPGLVSWVVNHDCGNAQGCYKNPWTIQLVAYTDSGAMRVDRVIGGYSFGKDVAKGAKSRWSATGVAALQDGSLLVGGAGGSADDDQSSGWVARLPACVTPQ